jgi:hypothetical protein
MAKSDAQKLAEVLASARPVQRPTLPTDADPESRLDPRQLFGVNYSREKYADGSYMVDPPHSQYNPGDEAAITSFYGSYDRVPAPLKDAGQYINYPTFWDGKVIDANKALTKALAYEAHTGGKFARYPTAKDADWGEMQVVHPIMDADAQKVLATPEAQKRLRNAK